MRTSFISLLKSSLREGWPMYFVALVTMVAGIFFGNWGAGTLDTSQATQLSTYLDMLVSEAGSLDVDHPQLVKTTITNNLIFIGIIYLLGLTVIGAPIILALLFVRGFSLGFTVGFLANERAGEGILIAISSVLPQNLLLLPSVYLAGVAALSFSCLLIGRLRNSRLPVLPGLVGYHFIIIIVSCMAAAAGLVEAFVTPELIKATVNLLIE